MHKKKRLSAVPRSVPDWLNRHRSPGSLLLPEVNSAALIAASFSPEGSCFSGGAPATRLRGEASAIYCHCGHHASVNVDVLPGNVHVPTCGCTAGVRNVAKPDWRRYNAPGKS